MSDYFQLNDLLEAVMCFKRTFLLVDWKLIIYRSELIFYRGWPVFNRHGVARDLNYSLDEQF